MARIRWNILNSKMSKLLMFLCCMSLVHPSFACDWSRDGGGCGGSPVSSEKFRADPKAVICGGDCRYGIRNSHWRVDPGCWYYETCVSSPENNSYFDPKVHIHQHFCFDWGIFGTDCPGYSDKTANLGIGQCSFLGIIRHCARLARPGTHGNPGVGTIDANGVPIYDYRYATQLCVYEDPMDGNDTDSDSQPLHKHTNLKNKTPAELAEDSTLLTATTGVGIGVAVMAGGPIGVLAAGIAYGIGFLVELGMNSANHVVIGHWHPQGQHNDNPVGCVNIPLAPGPPPLCDTITPMTAPAYTYNVCQENQKSTLQKPCVAGENGTLSSFMKPQIMVAFKSQIPQCKNNTAPATYADPMCVEFRNLGIHPNYATVLEYIHKEQHDLLPNCTADNTKPCVKLNVKSGLNNPTLFRVLYDPVPKNSYEGATKAVTEWIDLTDAATGKVVKELRLYGVDRGDFGFLSYQYNTSEKLVPSEPLKLLAPLTKSRAVRNFIVNEDIIKPDGTRICAYEVDNGQTTLLDCNKRARITKPVVSECMVNAPKVPTDPPCIRVTITDPALPSDKRTAEIKYKGDLEQKLFGISFKGRTMVTDSNYKFPDFTPSPQLTNPPAEADMTIKGKYHKDTNATTTSISDVGRICPASTATNCIDWSAPAKVSSIPNKIFSIYSNKAADIAGKELCKPAAGCATINNVIATSDIHKIHNDLLPRCEIDNRGPCVYLPSLHAETPKHVRVLYSKATSNNVIDLYSDTAKTINPSGKMSLTDLESLTIAGVNIDGYQDLYYQSGIEFNKTGEYVRGASKVCLDETIFPADPAVASGETVLALQTKNVVNRKPWGRLYPWFDRSNPDIYSTNVLVPDAHYVSGDGIAYANRPTNPGPCPDGNITDPKCLINDIEAARGKNSLELGLCVDVRYQTPPACITYNNELNNGGAGEVAKPWSKAANMIGVLQSSTCKSGYSPTNPKKPVQRRCAYPTDTAKVPEWGAVKNPCVKDPPPKE